MLHYTFNTAHTFDCSKKEFQDWALNLLRPIAQLAILEGQSKHKLPEPLDSYSVKVTVGAGCAFFDIYDQETILNSNAVCATREGEAECWEIFASLYQKLMSDFNLTQFSSSPKMPKSLPWLSTLILPVPEALIDWLPDFEQCFAKVLIKVISLPHTESIQSPH